MSEQAQILAYPTARKRGYPRHYGSLRQADGTLPENVAVLRPRVYETGRQTRPTGGAATPEMLLLRALIASLPKANRTYMHTLVGEALRGSSSRHPVAWEALAHIEDICEACQDFDQDRNSSG